MAIDPNAFDDELSRIRFMIRKKSASDVLEKLIVLLIEKQLITEDDVQTLLAD